MRAPVTPFTSLACIAIALAVMVSGVHAKDIATISLPALWLDAKKHTEDTGQQVVKAVSDLHHHSDATGKVQPVANDGQQADTRTLRLLHDKKFGSYRSRITDRLRLWWQLNSLYLS